MRFKWLLTVRWSDGTETRKAYATPAEAWSVAEIVLTMNGPDDHEVSVKRARVLEEVNAE